MRAPGSPDKLLSAGLLSFKAIFFHIRQALQLGQAKVHVCNTYIK
jgi:hypothetical protein